MARQAADAVASVRGGAPRAAEIARSLKATGKLLLLGMGGSHAVGRAVEPLYRAHGIDAIALPLSEQLGQPLSVEGKTILVTSQSGESAEVLRWFGETNGGTPHTFGLTLEGGSFLASNAPSLVGTVFYQQMIPFELDPQLGILDVTATNALRLTTGQF